MCLYMLSILIFTKTRMYKILIKILILFISNICIAQTYIDGIIINKSTGEAVQGATVMEEGSNTYTITNEDGEFHLLISSLPTTITYSHISYKKSSIVVK